MVRAIKRELISIQKFNHPCFRALSGPPTMTMSNILKNAK